MVTPTTAAPTVRWTERDGVIQRALDYPGSDPAVAIIPRITSPAATLAFVVHALNLRQRVIVPDARGRCAVADRAQSAHEQSLLDLNAKYADVVSLDATLDYIAQGTGRAL
jgi:hypothetical protein